jgi:molybdopterin-binding protein
VFCSPKNRGVAELVGVENIFTGTIVEKDGDLAIVEVNGRSIQVISDHTVGERVDALIRPENITFTLSCDPSSARNVLEGEITRMAEVGSLVRIVVDCGFPILGILTIRSARELGFGIGKRIYANFKATAIHVIGRRG